LRGENNMKNFITQQDEFCSDCGAELQKGSQGYVLENEEWLCEDCIERLNQGIMDRF